MGFLNSSNWKFEDFCLNSQNILNHYYTTFIRYIKSPSFSLSHTHTPIINHPVSLLFWTCGLLIHFCTSSILSSAISAPPSRFSILNTHLTVFKAQFLRQLLPIRFANVFLDLKSPLQPLPLEVTEDGPSHHASPRFTSTAVRPWEGAWEWKDCRLGSRYWCGY